MNEKESKKYISLILYISNINGKYYVGLEGNQIELQDFGIDNKSFNKMGEDFEKIIQFILGSKNEKN